MADNEQRIEFRPLSESDLPTMHRWLNDPGVVRWWEGEDVSWDAVTRDYNPANTHADPEEHWLGWIEDEPIGWIQCWNVMDGLEEAQPWFAFGVTENAAGIDYLIGATERRGQGLGSSMIRAFVFNVVFGRHCEWTQACASPYSANVASVRALAKAGFRQAGTLTYPDDNDGPCTLMVFDRPEA